MGRTWVEMYFYVVEVCFCDFFVRFGDFVVILRVIVGMTFCVRVRYVIEVFDRRVVDGLRDFIVFIIVTVVVGRIARRR